MFRFKQFAVRQDRCPMKVGTDGTLHNSLQVVQNFKEIGLYFRVRCNTNRKKRKSRNIKGKRRYT